ncbi:glycoside hydrolase family 5 protein [Novosphingobium sp. Fuku2-ISO-50]|uniref:glycoside hydrolase family 5 protein n=1 Tax=Novosphingobium sp. Fuku2-ISO-50 TaxID=1739114 RepID=UPI00076C04E2|nr:cellulase family glycosylhydrolase [Novosphingobium sp. Fuku2-ISO-50]KUR78739.1 hypothetical protein AQZ50_06125 [Novosphingobium sp. Fuku2-ISO-50]
MIMRNVLRLSGAVAGLALALAGAPAIAQPTPEAIAAQPQGRFGPGQVDLVRGVLIRDGRPWQMRGVGISGVVTPVRQLNRPFIGIRLHEAHDGFGPQLPGKVRAFGADTVVIKVSQPGLDPAHPIHDPAYRDRVVNAIRLFRANGLTVMISMQWQPGSGSRTETGFPTASTQNAWTALLAALPQDDGGLMFDLFNEPVGNGDEPGLWQQWKEAHEHVIAAIRNAGFHRQVVIVSGLQAAHWLRGAPPIADPDAKVVYGVHPYLNAAKVGFSNPANWDVYFGQFCTSHPCMATEWGLAGYPDGKGTGCPPNAPVLSRQLIEYLWRHRMGVAGWSFDYPDTLMVGPDLSRPTDFAQWNGQCPEKTDKTADDSFGIAHPAFGIGRLLSSWFHSHP